MAQNATLSFKDSSGSQEPIKVLECNFGFDQSYDVYTARPSGKVTINNINLVVESSRDTQLADWMVNNKAKRSGKIELYIQDNVKKTIEFEDAFCINYHESFNHLGGESPMHINFSIVTRKITLDGGNVMYEFITPEG
jgi:hypothetical protein